MKVYITKWALTAGINLADGDMVDDNMIRVNRGGYNVHFHKGEWHQDLSAAKARVMEMIFAKEGSITRKKAKLAKLAATIPLVLEENLKRL